MQLCDVLNQHGAELRDIQSAGDVQNGQGPCKQVASWKHQMILPGW